MLKIGITGQKGFIGTYLYNTLKLSPNNFSCIEYESNFFSEDSNLDTFISKCDVIVHLAAMNRHNDSKVIYDTNINLVKKLIASLKRTNSSAHVLFSSSSQEDRNNAYGKSKKDGRILLQQWAELSRGSVTGLIIPNVFGPFGRPYYNSVVATFSHQLSHDENPKIEVDSELKLIYIGELVTEILNKIKEKKNEYFYFIPHTIKIKVSDLLNLLKIYKEEYKEKGIIPALNNNFELNLFNTFRCYMKILNYFPVKFKKNIDSRGSFVEIIRLGVGGQVSFSTTVPGITRGNHFHTRKIERFAVIKGKALIQLRRIGTDKVLEFYLCGDDPSYVDMPIWYTHNIQNIGDDVLYTNFWINESYNPDDADTYFETV